MLGEVDTNSLVRVVNVTNFNMQLLLLSSFQSTFEAQYLANQVQLYYGTHQADRYALVKQFNHDPQNFDYNSLLAQLQTANINRASDKKI